MNRAADDAEPVHLVDASVYVFRAWYSMPDDFADTSGRPTNAVYGYARFICELLEQTGSNHVAVAFDESLTTSFRNALYPEYKANREPAPPELERQFRWCRSLTECLGLPTYASPEFEADDLIGTLAEAWRARGHPLRIVTSDKDLAQLVGKADLWWDFARRRRLDADGILEKFGVPPSSIADYLALTGDSVDNIPGVPGVGPKTAAALIGHFGGLDALYDRLEEVPHLSIRGAAKLPAKLRKHEAEARLARQLTGIRTDVPALAARPRVERKPADPEGLDGLLDHLGFGPLLRRRLQDLDISSGSGS